MTEAKLWRAGPSDVAKLTGPVRVERDTFLVFINDAVVLTTRLEFDLLAYLVTNAGRVISPKELFEVVIGTTYVPESGLLRVHVAHLRRKLGPAALALRTVRSRGLVWDGQALASASLDEAASPTASRCSEPTLELAKA